MAIKDSGKLEPGIVESNAFDVSATPSILDALNEGSVSYTHLTLPTISVV